MSSPAAASHWHYSPPLLRHRWRRTLRFFPPSCTSSSFHPNRSYVLNKPRLQQRSYALCVACRATMKPEPESDDSKDKHEPDSPELLNLKNSIKNINGIFASKISVQDDDDMDVATGSLLPGMKDKHEPDSPELLGLKDSINNTDGDFASDISVQEKDDVMDVASGSPLPGMKNIGESIRIPKATIDILKDQVFGFDTFFVTKQEPYEGGLLFRGNLRGKAAKSYEKITKRMQDRFGDLYKFFLLTDPEDDKPVAVVVPKQTFQAEVTAVPEWFAACAFGVVTIFTLLLRNVPALQLNLLSMFENPELLKNGLPGSIVTSLILLSHEAGHFLVARDIGVKLGVPYFVPSWQIGSFGAITRILSIVANREDLLKLAAAGPLVGFVVGLAFLILGLILPPADGIGVIVDSAVFHESFLAGGIAKLVLGDVLKEGTPISVNPLVLWSLAGLLINAINMIPTGDLDGGRISFALWGRKVYARLSAITLALLGISSLFSDVAFYWTVLIFFLQRGPISPLYEEITEPGEKYIGVGVAVLLLGLLICLPYPFPFFSDGTNFVL